MMANGHMSAEDSIKKWFNDRIILLLNCMYNKHEILFTEIYLIPEKTTHYIFPRMTLKKFTDNLLKSWN